MECFEIYSHNLPAPTLRKLVLRAYEIDVEPNALQTLPYLQHLEIVSYLLRSMQSFGNVPYVQRLGIGMGVSNIYVSQFPKLQSVYRAKEQHASRQEDEKPFRLIGLAKRKQTQPDCCEITLENIAFPEMKKPRKRRRK